MKKATAADRFGLGAALIESSNVLVDRQVAQDWAPRHGTYATPGLVGLVQSDDPEIRSVGLWTLTALPFKHADPRIVSVVKALSSDPDVDVRRAAVESAQFTATPGDEAMLAALSDRLLADGDFSVRRAAAESIRKLVLDRHTYLGNACRVLEPHLPQVFDIILRCWAPRRRDGHSKAEYESSIHNMRFTADELVASARTAGLSIGEGELRGIFMLASGEARLKLLRCDQLAPAVAGTAAKERLPEFVLEALIRTLMDANSSVRAEAFRSLIHVTEPGDARATRMLVESAEKGIGAMRPEVVQALVATAERGNTRVTMALATVTQDPRPFVRVLALDSLGEHVDLTDAASRGLVKHAAAACSMREETDGGVRKAALHLLSSLGENTGDLQRMLTYADVC